MRIFDGLIVVALGALAYQVYRLTGITMATETKAQALLREVGETVASNSEVLESNNRLIAEMTALLTKVQEGQNGGEGATDAELEAATASLQAVQDANAEAKAKNDTAVAAIEDVLNPTTGDTGTGSTGTEGGDVGGV